MKHLLLQDRDSSPMIQLLGCTITEQFLLAEIGFISMGLINVPYMLYDRQGTHIITVKLHPIMVGLPEDVADCMGESFPFTIV
jgi:hypothetical protein